MLPAIGSVPVGVTNRDQSGVRGSIAKSHMDSGFIPCPCFDCKNQKEYSSSRDIQLHLMKRGFMPNYVCWTKHGESGVMLEDDEEEFHNVDYAEHPFFADTMMGDGEDVEDTDALGAMLQAAEKYRDNENVRKKLERMMEDHKTPLYPDCKGGHKKLRSTLELLQWKATNCISDKAFTQLLKLIKEFLLEGNKLPETTYEAKEVVCPIGLEVQKKHSCPNDCILYRGKELEDLKACLVCKASRYKIRRNDSGDVEGEPPRKRIPAKVMWYFPIIPRLKRLFQNKEHAKMVRWHKEQSKEDDMLRYPTDRSQWRKVDRMYSQFVEDARNIRFGLSTDGMNPFSEMSSSHSTWPVTLCIYNLPPWLCLKPKFIMMPALIQGLKQPGNHIDVYLQPLVEELLELWSTGVRMWDEYKQEDFDLHAMLFVTINDWPALSNLLGQSNKGFRACTHYLDDTDIMYLKHCRKVVYMGNRRFLFFANTC
ncbi:hypothetical protein U9M48_037300 [Paspalum notatum var. saurae]|uniref:Transposase-associated domain-containing protein n=1 Tax=Paspalum notatum var. saurae TaxID=547442 RepID=A0AAQ3UJE1_PASNO